MSFPFFHNRITNAAAQPDPEAWDKWVNSVIKEASEEAKPGTGLPNDGKDDSRNSGNGQVINTEGEEAMTNDPEMSKEQGGNARPDKGGKTDQSDNKQSDKEGSAQTNAKQAGKPPFCPKCKCKAEDCTCDDKEASASEDVKEASCGKEMGESNDAGKVTETHTEAGPGDDENPEPKVLINNDPNYQKGESTNPGKVTGKNKKSSSQHQFKKVASLNRQEKVALIAQLGTNPKNPVEYIEAMVGMKIANLTGEEKEALRRFWLTMYDEGYVDDMLADR